MRRLSSPTLKVTIIWSFASCFSGENCFLVFKDPDGNNVEFYCDMLEITEDKPYEAKVWKDAVETFDVWRFEKFAVDPPAHFRKKDS